MYTQADNKSDNDNWSGLHNNIWHQALGAPICWWKTLRYFLLPGVCRRGSCGKHPGISQNIHHVPSYNFPSSSFKVASESQKLRSSIIRPQRRGQLPGLKATWVSHCEMTDWSDPVHEVPQSKRTALHCHSQGLKTHSQLNFPELRTGHTGSGFFRTASPCCTL